MIDASGERLSECGKQKGLQYEDRKRARSGITVSLINTFQCRFNLVRSVAADLGMRESADDPDILWTDTSTSVERCREMKRYQRTNHFPGMMEICRKDLLARNLNRAAKLFPTEYDFFPKTWCVKTDLSALTEYARNHKDNVFIVKPSFGCQGRGIALTNNVRKLKRYDDNTICQVYIQRPFLIDGYKFDLRVYALITSCTPLRVFVYNEGLARFATTKYKAPNSTNAANTFMHLTNYSVNKHSRTYVDDDVAGTKRKLSTINRWFWNNKYNVVKIWSSIDDVIIKTIMVSLPTVRHYYQVAFPHQSSSISCFELLGFDFIFDHSLKPYLLEVNHSPSFATDTAVDRDIKEALLYDTFNILNLTSTIREDALVEEKRRSWDRLFSVMHSSLIAARERMYDAKKETSRFTWELNHLGNYRRVYPCQMNDYYEQFTQPLSTVFLPTCSSRAKERTAPNSTNPVKIKKKKAHQTVKKSGKTSKSKISSNSNGFKAEVIDDVEEKERVLLLEKRESLIKILDIPGKVFESMNSARLLTFEKANCSRTDFSGADDIGLMPGEVRNSAKDLRASGSKGRSSRGRGLFGIKEDVHEVVTCHLIDEGEENERIQGMRMRQYLVDNCNLREIVRSQLKCQVEASQIVRPSCPLISGHSARSSRSQIRQVESFPDRIRPATSVESTRPVRLALDDSDELKMKIQRARRLREIIRRLPVDGAANSAWSAPEELNEPKIHSRCWRNQFVQQH